MSSLFRASSLRLLPVAAVLVAVQMSAQSATLPTTNAVAAAPVDRASAYYHYGLAHMYEDMAVSAGRPDYATQARPSSLIDASA